MIDHYVSLAKQTVETYITKGLIIKPPDNLPKTMATKQAGVFVSLHKKDGELRGCIGTFAPTKQNIAQEIISNAIMAATGDYRFAPVSPGELANLNYSVDILTMPKKVGLDFDLDPKKYGLIVSTADGRRGLLLPNISGVETPQDQISICKSKGGINPDEEVEYAIFEVERHESKE